MPKSVWEKAGDEAREIRNEAEAGADSLLDKTKESKWTSAILGGALAIIGVIALIVIF